MVIALFPRKDLRTTPPLPPSSLGFEKSRDPRGASITMLGPLKVKNLKNSKLIKKKQQQKNFISRLPLNQIFYIVLLSCIYVKLYFFVFSFHGCLCSG